MEQDQTCLPSTGTPWEMKKQTGAPLSPDHTWVFRFGHPNTIQVLHFGNPPLEATILPKHHLAHTTVTTWKASNLEQTL